MTVVRAIQGLLKVAVIVGLSLLLLRSVKDGQWLEAIFFTLWLIIIYPPAWVPASKDNRRA